MKFKIFFVVIVLFFISLVVADVISVNSGGGNQSAINFGGNIEGFFYLANFIPFVNNVVLNTTSVNNFTSDNLTVTFSSTDSDTSSITNITDWRVDGSSIAVLNMPFDKNYEGLSSGGVRDYSTYGNNGTLGGGNASLRPSWNSSCQVGGCYKFDGVNDYISEPIFAGLPSSFLTVCSWIKTSSSSNQTIVQQGRSSVDSDTQYVFRVVSGTGRLNFWDYNAGYGFSQSQSSSTIVSNGIFNFVCFVKNQTSGTYYLNGVSDGSVVASKDASYSSNNFAIGKDLRDDNYFFNGSIDEVQIYNRALSSLQIKTIYDAGISGAHFKKIVSNETDVGEIWRVAVTPNDRVVDGLTVLSNNLEIEATPSVCGNGIKETGEDCDGSDLDGNTCSGVGFDGGTLSCTSSCTFNTTSCTTDTGGTGGTGGDPGPGTGGGAVNLTYDFQVSPAFFNLNMEKGTYYQQSVNVTNTGTGAIFIEVRVENLQNFVYPAIAFIDLQPGESRILNLDIYVSESRPTDVYVGRVLLVSSQVEKDIEIVLQVEDEESLFDIRAEVLKKYITPGGRVRANVSIINKRDVRNFDIELEYKVINFDKEEFTVKKEDFTLDESHYSDFFFLDLPSDISVGNYLFYVKLTSGNATASSYDTFVVERISTISWIILILVILISMYLIYKRYKEQKEKLLLLGKKTPKEKHLKIPKRGSKDEKIQPEAKEKPKEIEVPKLPDKLEKI